MDLVYERGSDQAPKGHALLYFTSVSDPEEVWGTYLVLLPISVDVSKYVPPFLMNQVNELSASEMSSFAFPPAPEQLDGREQLEKLAEMRDDDVLYGGTFDPTDVPSAMMAVGEAVQRYTETYNQGIPDPVAQEAVEQTEMPGFGVNEVLYGLMSDNDKLGELTKLVGKLRFTVENSEKSLMSEAETDLNLLAKHLPDLHQVPLLIQATKTGGERGMRLADLYLNRCFHLLQQEYVKLGEVEAEIKSLESSGPTP